MRTINLAVEVTWQDLFQGVPNCTTKCPTTLAITRALGQLSPPIDAEVRVYDQRVSIGAVTYPLPEEVQQFVKCFDDVGTRQSCEPFAFWLDIHTGVKRPEWLHEGESPLETLRDLQAARERFVNGILWSKTPDYYACTKIDSLFLKLCAELREYVDALG